MTTPPPALAPPAVALLGTGTMGAAMARTMAGAGLPLTVWNRNRSRAEPLAEVGATVAAEPEEAVRDADVVVTMLFDADGVQDVMTRAGRDARPGAVWAQMSTVGVEGAERLGRLAATLDLAYVDAPVLGTKQPAEQGTLVVLASGPEAACEACRPVFDAVGSRTVRVGPAGSGSRLKLVVNAWVLTVLEGIAESLALARELGLDPRLFLAAVQGGPTDAPYVATKAEAMLTGDLAPAFTLAGAAKDAGLILAAARSVGVDAAMTQAVHRHLLRAVEAGHGDKDMAATYLEH